MTYDEFLNDNRYKLLGYFVMSEFLNNPDTIDHPYPPGVISGEQLDELKDRLTECMPLDSMFIDLWDWDIHFERDLSDDWYFETAFGSASSLESCAEDLIAFFLEACSEYDIDYNQSPDDPEFENLVREEAIKFIRAWRNNLFTRLTKSETPKETSYTGSR